MAIIDNMSMGVARMGGFGTIPPHMNFPPPAARRPPRLLYYEVPQVGVWLL